MPSYERRSERPERCPAILAVDSDPGRTTFHVRLPLAAQTPGVVRSTA
jgi:hypothetical protein